MSTNAPNQPLGILRVVAVLAVVAGAAASIYLMLQVGRNKSVLLLLILFGLWVLSPFLAFLLAERRSQNWPVPVRATLYSVMLTVALASVAIYREVVVRAPAKPAAMFLLVPLGSWLLLAAVVALAKRSPRSAVP